MIHQNHRIVGPKNHQKTIESNGVGAENQLMVMVEQPENH